MEEVDIWNSNDFWNDPEELTDDDVVIQEEREIAEDDDSEWFQDLMSDTTDVDVEAEKLQSDPYLSGWIPSAPVRKTNESARYAYNYLNQKGLPQHVSAGIVGNLMKESGLNPSIKDGDKRGGIGGIAQWDPYRSKQLLNFSASSNRNHQDLDTQLDFVLHESQQRGDLQKTLQTKTPEEAAYIFGKNYERPNEKYADWEGRQSYAKGVMNQMQYGGVNNIPEEEYLEGISDESIEGYLQDEGVELEDGTEGTNFGSVANMALKGIDTFNKVKSGINSFRNNVSSTASNLIDLANETAGYQRDAATRRKFNEQKNQKKYQLNTSVNNNIPIYT